MKNQFLIILLILLTIYTVSGQTQADCDSLLKKEITLEGVKEAPEEFTSDFKKLIACDFDSTDYQIFTGPRRYVSTVYQILLSSDKNAPKEKPFTFSDLRAALLKLKKEKGYTHVRKTIEAKNKILSRTGTLIHWEEDKNLLSQMGLGKNAIKDIHHILKDNVGMQYAELFNIYADTLQQRLKRQKIRKRQRIQTLKEKGLTEQIEGLPSYSDFNIGLKKAKETNKPVLLYFNAIGSVGSDRMEEDVLGKNEIQEYIQDHFIFVNLLVDDRTALDQSNRYFSKTLNRIVKYKGDLAVELEIKQFHSNRQPLFVIVDKQGHEISRTGYTKKVNAFQHFLKTIEQ